MSRLLTVVMYAAIGGGLIGFVLGWVSGAGMRPSDYARERWGLDDSFQRNFGIVTALKTAALFAVLAFVGYGGFLLVTGK